MEDLLQSLKEIEYLEADDQIDNLKNLIQAWYDGYNWLGPERVLNPYALVNLFA
jgi:hypothetical protein